MCIRDRRWIKAEGGVKEMERRAIEKADMLYAEIDRNKMFVGTAAKEDRSRIDVYTRQDYDIDASQATQKEASVVEKPWEIPSWSTFDVSAGYTFDFGKIRATRSGNVNNLFNQEYIADARDGSNHDWETATRVIYGGGRTYTVRLKLNF